MRDTRYQDDPVYRERHLAYNRDKWRSNVEYREQTLAQQRQRYDELKDDPAFRAKARENWRRRTYGITTIEFEAMIEIQEGKCAICRHRFNKTPHVDHNHRTGQIRGLLCTLCNTGIGSFHESTHRLYLAADYLERNKE